MSRQRFLVLLIAAAAALAAAFYFNARRNPPRETQGAALLPSLAGAMDSVTAVVVRKGGDAPVTVHKVGDRWTVAERGDYPADLSKLRTLLTALRDARIVEEKTSDARRYADIGVEDPAPGAASIEVTVMTRSAPAANAPGDAAASTSPASTTPASSAPTGTAAPITATSTTPAPSTATADAPASTTAASTTAASTTPAPATPPARPASATTAPTPLASGAPAPAAAEKYSVIVGKPVGEGNFVRRAGERESYSVEPAISFDTAPRFWIEPRLLDVQTSLIQRIEAKPASGGAYTLHRLNPSDNTFGLDGAPTGRKALDASALAPAPTMLANLSADDVSSAAAIDFSQPSRIIVTLLDGNILTLTGTAVGDKRWIEVQSSKDSVLAARTQGRAFEVAAYRYDAIFKPLDQLLMPKDSPAKSRAGSSADAREKITTGSADSRSGIVTGNDDAGAGIIGAGSRTHATGSVSADEHPNATGGVSADQHQNAPSGVSADEHSNASGSVSAGQHPNATSGVSADQHQNTPSGVSAGFGRRFAALIYDAFLLAALLMIFTSLSLIFTAGHRAILPETAGPWAYAYRTGLVAVVAGYYIVNWIRSGQTLGMRAWRLRAVSDTGKPLTPRSAALRFACGFPAWLPAALGVLWLYVDPEHLALHDRLSRTRVLRLGPASR